ncbi:MAG TPA: SDR family NAD(P)-dependent oxidoreductase [Acidobacteriota bacterium]|jgi:serine 3-dehydrogenase|nr:SDR family NAD(P)-dependent oxidoreductase [Acidobacteriota bacterium]HNR39806.1 SDR family NAD(P)-dependent oxidoreductase [Acidobacteriota bacterium]HNU01509.1 SDR family NAD(P)-dependent oxidoreductase [Acidobacteriota bacterium]HPB27856.1 SDR family NAD(P)-dependent oxidoreductase [Acidobacteriota bacterium]HQO26246.1 SDR family NAD(P)-dependent oxidoreductase [Acidobacteriota bacterium]
MNRLKDRIVVITGASAGIGQACAERFAAAGARLVLAARRADRLEAMAAGLQDAGAASVDVFTLDVRDAAAVAAFGDALEARGLVPHVLVNNAGLAAGLDKLHEGSVDDWDRMIDTNVRGLLLVSRRLIPAMLAAGRGHVINIGSIAGRQVYPNGNVYNATKFAVRALTEGMNMDLYGTPLRVSCVSPGLVETEFSLVRFHGDAGRAAQVYANTQPLTPADIADAVHYVANAPEHVNVLDMIVLPTVQRSATMLLRSTP